MVAYVDDVNIFSMNTKEHLVHLREVFVELCQAWFMLNPSKCYFFKKTITFLGFIIMQDGLTTDPSKISKISGFPQPMMITNLRSFLGLALYRSEEHTSELQ